MPAAHERRLILLHNSLRSNVPEPQLTTHVTHTTWANSALPRSVAAFAWPSSAEPIFEPYTFDDAALQRDGFVVLRGIMTETTRQRWRAACIEVQSLNDRCV